MLSRSRLLAVAFLSVIPASALASELTVRVVDPSSAAVSGAQVEVFAGNSSRPVAVDVTSAQGVAHFNHLPDSALRVRVLAAGFADVSQPISPERNQEQNSATIALHMAVATEIVVVSATRTPVPSDESGASIATLSGTELDTMRPVAANDGLRFLPGAIVSTAGQRGGLSSLFVRGGDSRYNKVIVDGVSVNDPGGTFDFGTLPLFEADRIEFLRGAESTLYGSDAMTSVVQTWSRTGSTTVPELLFGADAGDYGTENGYASLSGAAGRFDYNVFGNQFNTTGSGPNDDYSNSLEGANLGAKLNDWAALRLRMRHDNSVAGVQNEWNFNGDPLLAPDTDQRARQNNFLSSLELVLGGSSRWHHRLSGTEYSIQRTNRDDVPDRGCDPNNFIFLDCPFLNVTHANRAAFGYQGDVAERSWATSTYGYEFEDENGVVGTPPDTSHGLRRNHAIFGQQVITVGRLSFIAGGRFVHNESFGNKFVPRASLTLLALKGGDFFFGTRLHFGYATGIKEPSFAESFGNGGSFPTLPNPDLKPEETRAFEAGMEQRFRSNYALSATYFNNLFRNKIDFSFDQTCFCQGQYVNVNQAIAHGAEVELHGRPTARIRASLAYTYTSTQILKQPFAFDPLLMPGQPLLRRPKHSATALINYLGRRWGVDLNGSFVDRRVDSDFLGFGITHAPGYLLVNAGAWYQVRPRITAYVSGENLTNRFYEEVTGYPALGANFRAGVRFRVGGE
jgi:outer membrane cobalamin receptor